MGNVKKDVMVHNNNNNNIPSLYQGGVVMSSQTTHTHNHQHTPLSPHT